MNSWRCSSVMSPVAVSVRISSRHSSSVSLDVLDELVQVPDECLHQLTQTRILTCVEALDCGPGDVIRAGFDRGRDHQPTGSTSTPRQNAR